MLNLVHPLDAWDLSGLVPLLEACHRNTSRRGELRLAAHLMGGGRSDWEDRLSWLAARHTLKMFASDWEATDDFPNTRRELADRIRSLVDNRRGRWDTKDKPLLKKLSARLRLAELPAGDIDQAIAGIGAVDWLAISGKTLSFHALFWALLILLYPRIPMVQALFFWNPWVRRMVGLGYVGVLLAWIPWLRRLLFTPFRESLLADSDLDSFNDDHYYSGSLARCEQDRAESARSVVEAIPHIAGQIILVGESGLGKTMFRRYLVHHTRRVTAYLPAWKCDGGRGAGGDTSQTARTGTRSQLSTHPDLRWYTRPLH